MQRPRVSLRDIARAANVSHVTVSLALRNHPKISAATRSKIQALAEKMGFTPDPMLQALAAYRKTKTTARYQATLAWLNTFPEAIYPDRYHAFNLYRDGASERARQLGYKLDIFSSSIRRLSLDKLRKTLLARGIQGVLIGPHLCPNTTYEFDPTGFSVVAFGYSQRGARFHTVSNSQVGSISIAVEKLLSLGHKRIGLNLSAEHDERTAHHFLGGFLGMVAAHSPMRERPFLICHEQFDNMKWKRWFHSFRPDAIIVSNSEIAREIEALGLAIPQQLSIALLVSDSDSSQWAGINQNDLEIGRVAVDVLVGMLHRNETGYPHYPHRILVESTWRDGSSACSRD